MAVYTKNDKGYTTMSPDTRGNISSRPVDDRPMLNNAGGIAELASKAANVEGKEYSGDDMKYAIAVKTAQNRLAGYDGVTDDDMKREIDSIYEGELGAGEGAGRAKRGETWFTDRVNDVKDFINGTAYMGGQVIDGAFDTIVGEPMGWFGGDEARDWAQNLFDPEDAAIVADIAMDAGLSMIPGVGLPLVAAKNAIQSSDDIAEFISGVDNVTMDNLDAAQRGAKGFTSIASTALPMIPGIGRLKNAGKYSEDLAKANKGAKESQAKISKSMGDIVKGFDKNAPQGFSLSPFAASDDAADIAGKLAGKSAALDRAKELESLTETGMRGTARRYKNQVKAGSEDALQTLKRSPSKDISKLGKEVDKYDAELKAAKVKGDMTAMENAADNLVKAKAAYSSAKSHPVLAMRKMSDALFDSPAATKAKMKSAKEASAKDDGKVMSALKSLASPGLNMAASSAFMVPMAVASEMAESGGNPVTAAVNVFDRIQEGADNADSIGKILPALMPFGARGFARRQPNIKGSYGSRMPYPAIRAAAFSDYLGEKSEGDLPEGITESQIADRLRFLSE